MKFDKYLKEFQPWKVRLLARRVGSGKRNPTAITNKEIADNGGIDIADVIRLSRLNEWTDVTIGQFMAFAIGCEFDPLDPGHRNSAKSYMKKNPQWNYLRNSDIWETEIFPIVVHAHNNGWM